ATRGGFMRPALLAGFLCLAQSAAIGAAECIPEAPCQVGGGEYIAALPEGTPRGGVMILHGWGGTAAAEITNGAIVPALTARGYAVIAPVGLLYSEAEPMGNWNAEEDPAYRDDVGFLVAVADDAAARLGFPRGNLVAAGFSLGGMMVWRLACDAPEAFAAFAPVAGTFWRPMPERCAEPVRLLHTHGWTDTMVPFEGRPIPDTPMVQGDVFEALALIRRASGCPNDGPDGFDTRGELQIRRWSGCAPGADIAFALHPGGHTVPPGWPALVLDWFEAPPQ
ncbi:MAG TPA: alpha/beta fold hydrolase, partial [Paracoccaceae bacterium]|nr:alpha/beta fold hydrolase [Paracoccaceae bacterium]